MNASGYYNTSGEALQACQSESATEHQQFLADYGSQDGFHDNSIICSNATQCDGQTKCVGTAIIGNIGPSNIGFWYANYTWGIDGCAIGEAGFFKDNGSLPTNVCKDGCAYQPTGSGTDVSVQPGAIHTGYKAYATTGQSCGSDTPIPQGQICDSNGNCLDYDGQGHGTFCDDKGTCISIPNQGGCASYNGDVICAGPGGGSSTGDGGGNGGGTAGPNPPPPGGFGNGGPQPPPTPPILPDAGPSHQFDIQFNVSGGGGSSSTITNANQYTCGGVGQPPCATGPSACAPGAVLIGGACVSPVGPGSSCPPPAVYDAQLNECVAQNGQCPPGQVADNDGVCHAGSCPSGYTSVNGVCVPNPPQCGPNETLVNGVCQSTCPAGYTLVNGLCQPVSTITCVGGTVQGSGDSAVCVCPPGMQNVNGTCSTPPPPPLCVGGAIISGQCVCAPGMSLTNGFCVTPGGTGGGGTGGGGDGQGTDVCALHPNASGCSVHTASGGTDCDNPPACDGDPIMCNQLNQSWLERCVFQKEIGKGPTDADLDAATASAAQVKGSDETIDQSAFDESGWLGGGACPEIPTITVFGQSIHFESHYCDIFSWLGLLVVIAAYMWALKILGAG